MFTGIVEETGTVVSFEEQAAAYRLIVRAKVAREEAGMGDSIAVNGCCLTVVGFDDDTLSFDLLGETVRLTSFSSLAAGDPVNLERCLRFGGKIGGHFVTGHIDATATITTVEPRGKDVYLRLKPPAEFMKYLSYKGSVALDGISLTVAEVDASEFAVWLIPHTLEMTNLRTKQPGDLINVEFDMLAKAVERILPPHLK